MGRHLRRPQAFNVLGLRVSVSPALARGPNSEARRNPGDQPRQWKHHLVVARKQRLSSDPSLAHSHEQGATIELIQPAEHDRLGTVHFPFLAYWVLHRRMAHEAASRLED